MKYFVYFLKSLRNGDIYIGSTTDVSKRFASHNSGRVKSTKGYRPWSLLESIEYNSRSEAVRMEQFYKTGQQKEILKEKYKAA
jgi:putative endonuclease